MYVCMYVCSKYEYQRTHTVSNAPCVLCVYVYLHTCVCVCIYIRTYLHTYAHNMRSEWACQCLLTEFPKHCVRMQIR